MALKFPILAPLSRKRKAKRATPHRAKHSKPEHIGRHRLDSEDYAGRHRARSGTGRRSQPEGRHRHKGAQPITERTERYRGEHRRSDPRPTGIPESSRRRSTVTKQRRQTPLDDRPAGIGGGHRFFQ